MRGPAPTLKLERRHWDAGATLVAGVDEVGRGAWAGPLTVAVAIIPPDRRLYRIRDSKLLSEAQRELMFSRIAEWCVDWSAGHVSPEECDALGMSEAQRVAARRALGGLSQRPDVVLVDGGWDFVADGTAIPVVHGDRVSVSIAAASILAKVTRDRLMRALSGGLPWYDLARNKGYPSPTHQAALHAWGPSVHHRVSWGYMDRLVWGSESTLEA
jgi:ribonuclease HII